jgi:uncharacterized protein with ParB-like and HNH nuclease domain
MPSYSNDFKPICVGDLISSPKYKFIIPSFQRGYRWDEKQVVDLLEDIKRFVLSNNQGNIYYLQPLIVCKSDNVNEWYVLDGQQRLTTLKLILLNLKDYSTKINPNRINNDIYDLQYQSRALIDFNNPNKDLDINNYYVYNSNETIKKWINETGKSNNGNTVLEEMVKCLISETPINETLNTIKFVKFIWFEINQNNKNIVDQIQIYNRFNSNKIKLTPSELIKALYVLDNKKNGNDEKITNLLSEWNAIEKDFQNNKFWYLYSDRDIQTRIDYLFNVISDNYNSQDKDYDKVYREYQDKYDKGEDLTKDWNDVKDYYNNFVKVYEDTILNNYFGYLIYLKENPKDIFNVLNNGFNYDEVCNKLVDKIKKKVFKNIVDFDSIRELTYDENYDLVKKLLLLYNIETCNTLKKKFDFESFYKDKWEIEHVDSQNKSFTSNESKIEWLNNVIDALKLMPDGNNLIDRCNIVKERISVDSNVNLDTLKNDVDDFFCEKDQNGNLIRLGEDEKQTICNLALLDKTTNIAFSNSPFPSKRQYLIKERIEKGYFVPICTERIFLKYYNYTQNNETINLDAFHWTKKDRENYLKDIKEKLAKYLRG